MSKDKFFTTYVHGSLCCEKQILIETCLFDYYEFLLVGSIPPLLVASIDLEFKHGYLRKDSSWHLC